MMLLQNPEDRGYPLEYLLSRIRGRRSRLIKDWRQLVFDISPFDYLSSGKYGRIIREASPEGVWRNLMREYRWVYSQMNEHLREIFRPFFLYTELRTVFICLRRKSDKLAGRADELLEASLLSDEMKEVLAQSPDVPSAVAGLERILTSYSARFSGLGEVLDRDGLRGVEQRITNVYLTVTVKDELYPLMKTFFEGLIDSRNIMSLYKYLRLELKMPPTFIEGGSIPEAQLKEMVDKGNLLGAISLVRTYTGLKAETPDPTQVEVALYKRITWFLKRSGRDPLGIGLVLDYLWRCSIETMNLSVLYYGKDLEREAVTAELVQ